MPYPVPDNEINKPMPTPTSVQNSPILTELY